MAAKRTAEELEGELLRVQGELIALREVVDSIPHRVFWKDRNCVWMGGNRNLARDCRVDSPRDLVGRTDHDFFAKEHADFFQQCDREVMERGEPLLDIEEPQRRPDGSLAYLLTSKVPLRAPSGEVVGMAGIYVDITDRKRLEQEKQEALRAAEAAAEAKSNFLAVVSHELRTPLSLVLGPLESLLARARAGGRDAAELEAVMRNALRLKDLVDDVLDFSKAEAGKLSASWSRCDVGRLVGDLVADAGGAAAARDITLRSEVMPFEPVDCDPALLRKIVLNLLSNAIKFTPRGGRVTVQIAQGAGGERYELRVADTGPGVGEGQVGRLFQRFEQADSTATRTAEGTGLGLALVKEFAGLLGGEVGVETAVGKGSTFWVRLPVRREASASSEALRESFSFKTEKLRPAPQPRAVERAGAGPLRVVVAEDNPDMRAHISGVLGEGCQVTLCANGSLALAQVEKERPDVVVSDVMMPGMDGFELTRKIRESPALRATPVILLTARAGAEAAAEGLEAGADDYVAKPFSGPELLARVRAAARLHSLYRELDGSHEQLRRAHESLRQAAAGLSGVEEFAAAGQLALEAREMLAGKKAEAKRHERAPASDLQDALAILDRVTSNLQSLQRRPKPNPGRTPTLTLARPDGRGRARQRDESATIRPTATKSSTAICRQGKGARGRSGRRIAAGGRRRATPGDAHSPGRTSTMSCSMSLAGPNGHTSRSANPSAAPPCRGASMARASASAGARRQPLRLQPSQPPPPQRAHGRRDGAAISRTQGDASQAPGTVIASRARGPFDESRAAGSKSRPS